MRAWSFVVIAASVTGALAASACSGGGVSGGPSPSTDAGRTGTAPSGTTTTSAPSPKAQDGGTASGITPDAANGTTSDAANGAPCRLTSDCASYAATFCQKDSCDPMATGTCEVVPGTRETGCCQPPSGNAFVCGCDGQTYAYACLAHAESVNIASEGPCPVLEGGTACSANTDCGAGLYCQKDSCGAAQGTCQGEPDFQVCYGELDGSTSAVCGCDHVTYDNACMAASYGVDVASQGACPPPPSGPCTSQADCGGSDYAAIVYCAPTACGSPAGKCTSIPVACPEIYMPVCGCDGVTYPNDCFAELAKVGWEATDGGCP